ncbi:hypothetical protein BJL95_08430 [Methylomonas sp. LWB]|uniref:hypothetical protein n=1 Tax=Methylomonas sp. LWB TaxID=1905845 RepID=UPI0008DB1B4D|nr:hypothetical protein [Methylomonas sp. LWB]OHX37813.1 hypothetical protein BJL95_08430 [Methylomonas sp. LWB]
MTFPEYKMDVIKHEVGHWVIARQLGFKTGKIEIEILSNRSSMGHMATATICPEPDINGLDPLLKYIECRVCILFAGVISQLLDKSNKTESTAAALLDTDGADDKGKIKDLLFIARGIRFSGSIHESNEHEQMNALQKAYWERANDLVLDNRETILSISEKIAPIVSSRNKRYVLQEDQLKSWFDHAAA